MLSLELTNQNLESELNIVHVTNEEIQEIISSYHENDVSVFFDKNLTSLINDLLYNGYDFSRIQELDGKSYGNFLEFYYIPEENQYAMIAGVR